jgi:hypothetical protein
MSVGPLNLSQKKTQLTEMVVLTPEVEYTVLFCCYIVIHPKYNVLRKLAFLTVSFRDHSLTLGITNLKIGSG